MAKTTPPVHYIIYADDDQDDLELIRECFDKYTRNVELMTFENGYTVYNYLNSLPATDPTPCLVILDINMPVMDGKEVALKLRRLKRFESVPILLFTTSSQPHDKIFARQFDIGFMTKPLHYHQMELISESFIEHCTDEIKKLIQKKVGP